MHILGETMSEDKKPSSENCDMDDKSETDNDIDADDFFDAEDVHKDEKEGNLIKLDELSILKKELRDLQDRVKILESTQKDNFNECDSRLEILEDYNENEEMNRWEDLKDNSESNAKNIEELERQVQDLFNTSNDYECKIEKLTNTTEELQKSVESNIAVDRRNINDIKYIVENSLKFVYEKLKKDVEGQEKKKLDITNALFGLINLIENIDKNVYMKLDDLKNKIKKLSEENEEFEKIFYDNFSSLCHGLHKKDDSPGNIFATTRAREQTGCLKLKFKSQEIIKLPYYSTEICARILTVDSLSPGKVKSKILGTDAEEKVVLLVGVTGAGKSTLIDAIANFYYNVRYEDKFRLSLVVLSDAEKKKQGNQATSQTDEITVYKLPYLKNGNAKGFKLTIIDTPGIADTRGISQDKKIIEKLRYLFEDGRISFLNSVCFVSNAGNARLTAGQKYIFDSLITNFGVDLVNNIIGLFTFDDGGQAKAIDAFKEARIGLTANFKFNSQAMLHQRMYQTPVNKTIMMTMEAQDCVQFQHFYQNCDDFFGTLSRFVIVFVLCMYIRLPQ